MIRTWCKVVGVDIYRLNGLANGERMNAFGAGLLVVALLLATVAVGCAEQLAESAPLPARDSSLTDSPLAPGGEPKAELGTTAGAPPVVDAEPAPEFIKVSRLEPSVIPPAGIPVEDRQLELRKADFLKFAESKLGEMNRNHILSRERMRIQKLANGSYQASFHQIDDDSMSFEVKRSPTKSAPYVAVLSYREQVYSAPCSTPAACRQGDFTPVEMIPNRHIFVYRNGAWQ
jgi:hypothetical protein